MKRLLTIVAFSALAVPTAFAAPPDPSPSPAQLCKQQRQSMPAADFASIYAPAKPKSALGKCISRQSSLIASHTANAAKQCKAERGTTTPSIAAFNEKYGKNENKKNAYGKCVSSKAKQAAEAGQEATLSAAKTCKTLRATNRAGFEAAYGTKKNAFGKCVSQHS